MKAVCFVYEVHSFGPEQMIDLAKGKFLRYSEVKRQQKRTCGITRWVTTEKVDHYYEAKRCANIQELGDIDITGRQSLVVVGGRDSVLELFQTGNVERTIKVDMWGVKVGVFRQQKTLHGDVVAVKVDCVSKVSKEEKSVMGKDRVKKGNFVHTFEHKELGIKKNSFWWNTFDVTHALGLSRSGHFTVHPRAFHDPIKNIFNNNKW